MSGLYTKLYKVGATKTLVAEKRGGEQSTITHGAGVYEVAVTPYWKYNVRYLRDIVVSIHT